jgi:phosphoenolpyruvate carboxykinase (ATP)
MSLHINEQLKSALSPSKPRRGHDFPHDWAVVHDELEDTLSLKDKGITIRETYRNPSVPFLYESGLKHEVGTNIMSSGALACRSGQRTGRSPKDKRIVKEETSEKDVWWGPVNIPLTPHTFMINRERAIDYLNTRDRLYVFDGYAGWVPKYRLKVRVICARAYHCLFMRNMLVRPTDQELKDFQPDFHVYNAGGFPANRYTEGMNSSATSVSVNFARNEMVILGTDYAGEMKKGIFTVMHYLMPKQGVLSLHSSCNVGKKNGDPTLFFGLSGTGKTTLSTDPKRQLIGDDEHCWYEDGVFNIEGGCYAKCIDLKQDQEPEIFNAIRFGSVLENVIFDDHTRAVDFADDSITENTRTAYPIDYIPEAIIPCVTTHPRNIVFLTCDACGILPPVSKLTAPQAAYHFITGYTAKVAGTEEGITEPELAFSPCFGAAFIVRHPAVYADMLAEKMKQHSACCWLVNTGWVGGAYGTGSRIKLRYSRAIIDAIHEGTIDDGGYENMKVFNLAVPKKVEGVPSELLMPSNSWKDGKEYEVAMKKLANRFVENFKKYEARASEEVKLSGPILKE